jgi:Tol biopolymer transport system component
LVSMTPTYANATVQVYEIGGSDWSVTPAGAFDGHADFSPDSQQILVASGVGYTDTKDLYTLDLDGGNRTLLATAPVSVRNPRWSPNADRIAFSDIQMSTPFPSSSIYTYDVGTQEFTILVSTSGSLMDHVSWSPVKLQDHYMLAYDYRMDYPVASLHDLWIVNADTGESQLLYGDYIDEVHPSFSPDGMLVAFSSQNESMTGTDLFAYGMVSQEVTQLTFDGDLNDQPSWCSGS